MITEQSYGINLFQFAEACLLVSCRVLFYTERSFELFLFCGMVRNGIPSCFFFRGMVRSRILRVCFYFCSTERNSEFFSLPRKGSERNTERLLFRGTAGIPSEMIICSVYSVFRGIIFCRKFPTLVITTCYWCFHQFWCPYCCWCPLLFQFSLVLMSVNLEMCSYFCCFFTEVPDTARFSAVAVLPTVV